VRTDSDNSTLALQVFDGGDGGADTSIISDLLSVKRDIEIATDQNFLSLQLIFGEVFDSLFGHFGIRTRKCKQIQFMTRTFGDEDSC
jgi:hypothetical protein